MNQTHSRWECQPGNYIGEPSQMNERELERVVIGAKIWKIHNDDGLFEMTDNVSTSSIIY